MRECGTRRAREAARTAPGFTLVEMLIVVGIIILTASITLPSAINLFTAGSHAQAYNVMLGQLSAARALGVRDATFAGVHVQLGDGRTDAAEKERCYAAIVIYDRDARNFRRAAGFEVSPVPGTVAFGELSSTFVTPANSYQGLTDGNLPNFTSFTVVFSPSGSLVRQVEGQNITFDGSEALFSGADRIWIAPAPEAGATAITMFDYAQLKALDANGRVNYLNKSGQFLSLNIHTGQLTPRR